MAKAKEKELPKHIKEFYDKDTKIKRLIDTTHAAHSEAYLKGLDAIRNEKGEIDYEQLEDIKKQDAMLEKMMDVYMSKALKSVGLKEKPKDEFEQDMIIKRYIGITKNELKRVMRDAKGDYTLEQHEGIRDNLIKKQKGELMPLRHSHFEESHMEDILKHVGVSDYIAKDKIKTEHAAGLLDFYKQKGEVTLSDLEHLSEASAEKGGWGVGKVYFTDKGKEGIKGLKDKYKKAA